MPGKIITIANQKGGVGKSTLSILIGSELPRMCKGRVMLVDADDQNSVVKVYENENELKPFPFKVTSFNEIQGDKEAIVDELTLLAEENDYVIVDTKGKRENWGENEAIISVSDMIIVPIQPDQFAIDATVDTIEDYQQMIKPYFEEKGLTPPELRILWLLPLPSNFLSIEKALVDSSNTYLEERGIKTFSESIHNWSEIKQSLAYSEPVSSVRSGGKAVVTIRKVCNQIIKLLKK